MSSPAWNTAPAEPLPLRLRLPKISAETRVRLIAWALRQPAVAQWLVARGNAYYDAAPATVDITRPDWMDQFALYDATSALDLLEWQTGLKSKEAVDRLEMLDEVASV